MALLPTLYVDWSGQFYDSIVISALRSRQNQEFEPDFTIKSRIYTRKEHQALRSKGKLFMEPLKMQHLSLVTFLARSCSANSGSRPQFLPALSSAAIDHIMYRFPPDIDEISTPNPASVVQKRRARPESIARPVQRPKRVVPSVPLVDEDLDDEDEVFPTQRRTTGSQSNGQYVTVSRRTVRSGQQLKSNQADASNLDRPGRYLTEKEMEWWRKWHKKPSKEDIARKVIENFRAQLFGHGDSFARCYTCRKGNRHFPVPVDFDDPTTWPAGWKEDCVPCGCPWPEAALEMHDMCGTGSLAGLPLSQVSKTMGTNWPHLLRIWQGQFGAYSDEKLFNVGNAGVEAYIAQAKYADIHGLRFIFDQTTPLDYYDHPDNLTKD